MLFNLAIYDLVWDELDKAVDEKKLVACRRISSDPFSDKNSDRLGIKLDVVYQVLDVCAAHAGATSTTDALDVGLVCIRNLQVQISIILLTLSAT